MLREMVTIDEELCDGCAQCIPACHEGALRIIGGKARLVSERLCDGLGACLGHCPRGAIRIERREAAAFDEAHLPVREGAGGGSEHQQANPHPTLSLGGGGIASVSSALRQWPVQLHLVSPLAPFLRWARLLVAADCVPVAYAGFHAEMLREHAVVIACPKLDDTHGYVDKLAEMIRHDDLAELTVVHMEVPCCIGILHAVLAARQAAKSSLPVNDITIGTRGQVLARRQIPADAPVLCETQPACCNMRTQQGAH